jgi:hypothetical protein
MGLYGELIVYEEIVMRSTCARKDAKQKKS